MEEGERLIALSQALVAALTRRDAATAYRADADYVFAHPRKGSPLKTEWYVAEFRQALADRRRRGLLRPFHGARHGAPTNPAAAGVSPMAIMGIAGHRSMSTTKQYVHLAGVAFADEAAALEQRMLGSVPDSGTKESQTSLPSASG